MSERPMEEAWQLCRTVMKERDRARAELDTLRLLTIDLVRERDQARAVAHDCYEALRRHVRAEGRAQRERWEEVDQLGDRLRRAGWMLEPPAIDGDLEREPRCPHCGLRLVGNGPCLLCSTGDQTAG